jgi:hypothetical protein
MLKGIDLRIPMGKEVEKRALYGLRSPSYLLASFSGDNKSQQLRPRTDRHRPQRA